MATSREIPTEVTQMVTRGNQHTRPTHSPQGSEGPIPEANKIGASTPFDFEGKNLTAYGGLLPVATMLAKLAFQQVVEETLTVKRATRSMTMYQFVLAMVLALYVGFSRLNHLRFLEREPMLVGILKVLRLPPQCTFWRFLASLHLEIARQLLDVQRCMRERVWEAAHVRLKSVTLDTDTTVHTLFGQQMGAQELQPAAQGEEELPAHPDVSGRDAGVPDGRASQRRPAERGADCPASGARVRGLAERGGEGLRAGRL